MKGTLLRRLLHPSSFRLHHLNVSLARALLALPGLDGARAVLLPAALALVILARVVPRHVLVPSRVVRPRPLLRYRAVGHRAERAGLRRRALVDVDDEAAEHYERGDVVNEERESDDPARHDFVDPHQRPRDEK